MSQENITPAVNLQEEMPNEMSAAEFQRRLYAWFEDRGLLSELRAHLRKQMIGVLKDTAIGRTVAGQQKQTISPKLQALNLLIAEFLLHQDYHYSLSVFSTEVPLVSVLPEFPGLTISQSRTRNDDSKKWQFSEKDMWDLLETLGIQQGTEEGQNIFTLYYNSINKESLLTCVIRMLHSLQHKLRTSIGETKDTEKAVSRSNTQMLICDNYEGWMKSVTDVLSLNNVNPQGIKEIINILIEIIETEKKRLKKEAREDYLKLQTRLQAQVAKSEEEQKKKWAYLQESLEFEKTKMQTDKMRRQMEADSLGVRVQRHQSVLRERYQQLLSRERDVHEREFQVRQKEQYLESQQHHLQAGFDSLYREQQTVTDLQNRLQRELSEKQKAAKNDAEFLRSLQEECQNMRTQIADTQEAVLSAGKLKNEEEKAVEHFEHDAEQPSSSNLIEQLQRENCSLRMLNSEQQQRIEELSRRAAVMMHDLENTQAAVDVLNSTRHAGPAGVLSAPPLAAPPSVTPHHRDGVTSYSGGGEEGSRGMPPPTPRQFRNVNARDIKRRTPPRRLTVHSSSSSDDPSPTSDILQEARERLRRLEQESEEVDRQYTQFRARRSENGQYIMRRHFRPSPFGSASWLSDLDREFGSSVYYQGEARSEPPLFASRLHSMFEDTHNNLNNVAASTSQNYPEFCRHVPLEVSDASKPAHVNLSKRLKQANNFSLSQSAAQSSNQQAQSYKAECAQNQHEASSEEDKADESLVKDPEREENDEKYSDNQSVASSGILEDMLAAGTSGVSLSGIETTDEKSDSHSDTAAE